MKKTLLALALIAALPVAAQAQDAEAGKAVFNVCKACHAVGEGRRAKAIISRHRSRPPL